MIHLFVYGTLAPGRSNHEVVEDIAGEWQSAILQGWKLDKAWSAEFGYPGIASADQTDEVAGYVLSSNELANHWQRLDEFEGSEYLRKLVKVKVASGELIEAHVYTIKHI
jgi:gamma-glutamylcyclotransferase (GGCT)/AIG2-like uncharacterized protein YtfP